MFEKINQEHIGKDKAEKVTKILSDFLQQKKSVQNPEQTGVCTTGGHVVLWAKNDVLNAIKDTDERNTLADILIHDEKVFLDFNRRNFESTVSQDVLTAGRMNGFKQSNSDRPCETKGRDVLWAKDESSKRMKEHEVNEIKPNNSNNFDNGEIK